MLVLAWSSRHVFNPLFELVWEQCFLISFQRSSVLSSLRQNITVHNIFFKFTLQERWKKTFSLSKEWNWKSHHLHQNRTRSTYKLIAIKQIFKENENKTSFVFGSYSAPLEVTENPRLPLHTRASTDLSGIWKYHPSSYKFKLS